MWISKGLKILYSDVTGGGGGGEGEDGVIWRAYTVYLTRFRTYKIALPPQTKPRRGGGLRYLPWSTEKPTFLGWVHGTTTLCLLGPLAAAKQDLCCFLSCIAADVPVELTGGFLGIFFLSMYWIQHCFICAPSDSTLWGCWDRTQDSCDFGIGCQTLYNQSARPRPRWMRSQQNWLPLLQTQGSDLSPCYSMSYVYVVCELYLPVWQP